MKSQIMKIKSILLFLFIELIIIGYLAIRIYQKRPKILVAVNPIKKENIVFNKESQFKYFYEPEPNTVEKQNDYVSFQGEYTINSDQLNERFEYSIAKPNDVFRIISLGDSNTFGLFVNTKDNWPEQLEDLLNTHLSCKNIKKFEVINLAVSGYDIQYSVERFKIKGIKYNPDLVLWFLKDDDFEQVFEMMTDKEQYYRKQLRNEEEYDRYIREKDFFPSWTKAMDEIYKEFGEQYILNIQEKELERFFVYFGGKTIVFTYSFTQQKYKDIILRKINKHRNLYLFDELINIYEKGHDYFFPDSHPNEAGYKLIANDLFNYLTKNKIIVCH